MYLFNKVADKERLIQTYDIHGKVERYHPKKINWRYENGNQYHLSANDQFVWVHLSYNSENMQQCIKYFLK